MRTRMLPLGFSLVLILIAAIVLKDVPEGQYHDCFHLENREKVLEILAKPGNYEVHPLAAATQSTARYSK